MGKTLYDKIFESHTIRQLPSGKHQVLVGLHLVHEVTSPQAFSMLREAGLEVLHPERTFATCDHVIPTDDPSRPFADPLAEEMIAALEDNCRRHNIRYFAPARGEQGIMHVVGPEMGLTQPGMVICCGDSHTATHGALGALAMGIGTSQVKEVLATQTLALARLKVRRILVDGRLGPAVTAKDVALFLVARLGVQGGIGYAHEYAGEVMDGFNMEERMTVCNLAIEGGAVSGYVNPDQTTYDYLRGRPYAPPPAAWERALAYWDSVRSDSDAEYDDQVQYDGRSIEPMVTWGINPGQAVAVGEAIPDPAAVDGPDRARMEEALRYMDFEPGTPVKGRKVDVAFIGSCTNGRLSDFEAVAGYLKSSGRKVAPGVRALAVPGSQAIGRQMAERGIARVLEGAGFEVRQAGCSMCLAMNPDKLQGRQLSASSSNRNFKGRQGSAEGRTLLMSPLMVAASAVTGEVADPREVFGIKE
jgi:3-isopropylmalate/(R)-2-methylmalate dehydratase large subunit